MCGRFDVLNAREIIAKIIQIGSATIDIKPSYYVAPSQDVAIVVNDGKNRLVTFQVGVCAFVAKSTKTRNKMINARSESVVTSKSFKYVYENHRGLEIQQSEEYRTNKTIDRVSYCSNMCRPCYIVM